MNKLVISNTMKHVKSAIRKAASNARKYEISDPNFTKGVADAISKLNSKFGDVNCAAIEGLFRSVAFPWIDWDSCALRYWTPGNGGSYFPHEPEAIFEDVFFRLMGSLFTEDEIWWDDFKHNVYQAAGPRNEKRKMMVDRFELSRAILDSVDAVFQSLVIVDAVDKRLRHVSEDNELTLRRLRVICDFTNFGKSCDPNSIYYLCTKKYSKVFDFCLPCHSNVGEEV